LASLLDAAGDDVHLYGIMGDPADDMPGTTPDVIDGADADEVRRICGDADVIYLLLNAHHVDWATLFPPRLDAAIGAATAAGATLVYHDNVYMYGDVAGPLTEDLPYAARTRKGALRGAMATSVLELARSGSLRGVVARSADMYGPGALNSSFNSTLCQRHFYPLLAGKRVSIHGDARAPHTYAYVDDVARDLAMLAAREEAIGDVWHLPAAPTLSHEELITIAAAVARVPPRVRGSKIGGGLVRMIGAFQRDVAEVAEMLYQFQKPSVVSHGKFERAFGAAPTPHADAMERTLAWYREHPQYAM
jgi:nucleoside-diphosphate-sugar epimerase